MNTVVIYIFSVFSILCFFGLLLWSYIILKKDEEIRKKSIKEKDFFRGKKPNYYNIED